MKEFGAVLFFVFCVVAFNQEWFSPTSFAAGVLTYLFILGVITLFSRRKS